MFGEIADADITKVMSRSYCILDNRKLEFNNTTEMYGYTWNKTYCEEDYSCIKDKNTICVVNVYVVRILLAAYMMFAAVLMLNLMVAGMFGVKTQETERYNKFGTFSFLLCERFALKLWHL